MGQILEAHNRTRRIESDTPIVPRAVVEAACEEAGLWLGQPLPRRWVRELVARAQTIYPHNPRFRRKVRANGERGRDYLWAFARHWLAGLLSERRPELHARMLSFYNVGQPLPPKPPAPPRRFKTVQRIPSPAKLHPHRRRRPAPDCAFAAAAHFPFP